jgi:uncharacterized membrane protein YkvA (DUF1232 family)
MTTFPLKTLYNWYRELVANPKYRWWIIGGTLLYLVSPLDILPDVLPIVGQIDDAVLITLVATELSSAIKDRNAMLKQQRNESKTVMSTVKIKDFETDMASGEVVEVAAVEVV